MPNRQRSVQAPSSVIMIRPHRFQPNGETGADNSFQSTRNDTPERIAQDAYEEVTRAASALNRYGVSTHLFEDEGDATPDSVFPNNWFSTHPGGHVAIFPMYAQSRRRERRADIIEFLKTHYRVQDVIDYSGLEPDGVFLEGTGAMVLDHLDRVAYAVRSNRTDPVALERFCTHFNYEPIVFDAADKNGVAVYHTNVLMCIATEFALVCLDMIRDKARANEIMKRLEESGRTAIALSEPQIENFAGNAIELQAAGGRVLALSERAAEALQPDQIAEIEKSARLVVLPIPTIELAGGSVRCMMAGIHLSARKIAI